jgi:hypothetical protein
VDIFYILRRGYYYVGERAYVVVGRVGRGCRDWIWLLVWLTVVLQSHGSRRICTCASMCLSNELSSGYHGILLVVILPFVLYCDHCLEMQAARPSSKILSNAG